MFEYVRDLELKVLDYEPCIGFCFDGQSFIFLTQDHQIKIVSEEGALESTIETSVDYDAITYDVNRNCYWVISEQMPGRVIQLDRELKECSYLSIHIRGRGLTKLTELSYCAYSDKFLLCCNEQYYIGNMNGFCRKLTYGESLTNLVGNVQMNGTILVYITRTENGEVFTVLHRGSGLVLEQVLLPLEMNPRMLYVKASKERQGISTLYLFGEGSGGQACMLSYELSVFEEMTEEFVYEPHELNETKELETASCQREERVDCYNNTGWNTCCNSGVNPCCNRDANSCCNRDANPCCNSGASSCCYSSCGGKGCRQCCQCKCVELLESIAYEETALSHILNAEGEKIQMSLQKAKNVDELIRVNESVRETIISTCHLEQVLYAKLECILKQCSHPNPCGCCQASQEEWCSCK